MTNGVGCDINGSTNAVGGNGNQKINGGRCLVPYANGVRFHSPGSRPRRAPWGTDAHLSRLPQRGWTTTSRTDSALDYSRWLTTSNAKIRRKTRKRFLTPLGLSLFESTWIHKRPAEDVATERGIGIDRIYVARSRVLKRLRYEVGVLADDWNG